MPLLFFFILSLIFPSPASAETPNLLTVSPSIIRLDLATDKPETVLEYKNNSNNTIELSLSASDFNELEHGYEPAFINQKDAKNYKYSLSSWISFDKNTILIAPKASEKITVFINKDQLSPGGHYGSIQASVVNPNTNDAVAIQSVLSSLVFVRTNTGKENESAKIQSLELQRNLLNFPKTFTLRFQNTGDTDLIPYGLIIIKDIFGSEVARGILNEGSLITLPESIRSYEVKINSNIFLFPSLYTAEFKGHFGKTNQKMEKEIKFLSEGSLPIIFICSIAIIAVITFYRFRKRA